MFIITSAIPRHWLNHSPSLKFVANANTKQKYQTELTPAGCTTRLKLTFCPLITVDVIVAHVRVSARRSEAVCRWSRRRVCMVDELRPRPGRRRRRYEARSTRAARWAIVARLINNIIHD